MQSFKSQDVSYQSFWAANMLVAEAVALVEQLAARQMLLGLIQSARPLDRIRIAKFSVRRTASTLSNGSTSNALALGVRVHGQGRRR